jgi:acetyl-CoA synthetase
MATVTRYLTLLLSTVLQLSSCLELDGVMMPDRAWIENNGDVETYKKIYRESVEHPGKYWSEVAQSFEWRGEVVATLSDYDNLYSFNFDKKKGPIYVEWFKHLKTNLAYNALDLQIEKGLKDKVALYHERNEIETSVTELGASQRTQFTYSQLRDEVCVFICDGGATFSLTHY